MEFHISRSARDRYHFDESLFSYDGNYILANFHAARVFAQKINAQRDLVNFPELAAKAGQLNAMGLIDEIFHHIFKLYREQKSSTLLKDAAAYLHSTMESESLESVLTAFIREFPPLEVYLKQGTVQEYLHGRTAGVPNNQLLIEELIMLSLEMENPALENFAELFSSPTLKDDPRFVQVLHVLNTFFEFQPRFGPRDQSLLTMLRSPAREVPNSITGQLEYIREHWSALLGDYLYKLLSNLDLLKEENKLGFSGTGPIPIPVYDAAILNQKGGASYEPEAFSPDREWMPRLVLIAKNTYVWLDQLSRQYQTPITRLDQIPMEELETLARRGITGLWLIGLWERSSASARIKQLCGNPEAISSAYSLNSYQIADELGGEGAHAALREKAARVGIRLASDMVPNHMGIDSEWMHQNPDWFLALDQCPYPSYQFEGPDLSTDTEVAIQIEDHYYDRTDAAVVFRRQDKRTGETRYIYHGNDGTSMPWNDTAQLNYLKPEVREAVIQTILQVARKFPIIRFDAAMTLAKKHIQRLWFPQPGSGGAIPSRAEHGMSQAEFDRLIPQEFWRELVDRAALEAPDTLLLAEAFWMMEGYFVRTLGMHRVYNSAFMNMLRNEDNAGYRKIIKNTLEFEPEILKRFVNFMNNPDERTAVEQFGKDDKYFGICMLMATMPGLPMLGHGQVEGFSEKYGMEFRKAYWQETIDQNLVARHEREIFPLLHQRRLFAGIEEFWMYDYHTSDGGLNENVYCYTNHENGNSALVIFNNNFNETDGWVLESIPCPRRKGTRKTSISKKILQALHQSNAGNGFLLFRDQVTGLQYLRPIKEVAEHGFHFHLRGYEYHAFLDFRVVIPDQSHDYAGLFNFIGEGGVPDIDRALNELFLKPVLEPFRSLVNSPYLDQLISKYSGLEASGFKKKDSDLANRIQAFIRGTAAFSGNDGETQQLHEEVLALVLAAFDFSRFEKSIHLQSINKRKEISSFLIAPLAEEKHRWYILLAWAFCSQIGKLKSPLEYREYSLSWLDEFQLAKQVTHILAETGLDGDEITQSILILRILFSHQDWFNLSEELSLEEIFKNWFSDPDVRSYLQVNRYNDVLWYNRERFEELNWWLMVVTVIKEMGRKDSSYNALAELVLKLEKLIGVISKVERKSGYQVDRLMTLSGKRK